MTKVNIARSWPLNSLEHYRWPNMMVSIQPRGDSNPIRPCYELTVEPSELPRKTGWSTEHQSKTKNYSQLGSHCPLALHTIPDVPVWRLCRKEKCYGNNLSSSSVCFA